MKNIKAIIFANQKGGVGKSTSALNLAIRAALKGIPTRLIGGDSQLNAEGILIGYTKDPVTKKRRPPKHPDYDKLSEQEQKTHFLDGFDNSSIADIFYGITPLPYPTEYENLTVFPADEAKLSRIDNVKNEKMLHQIYEQLCIFIAQDNKQNSEILLYVIDTPASQEGFTICAHRAGSHLVIPTDLEKFSLEGIDGVLQLYQNARDSRPEERPYNLVGVLVSKINRRRTSSDIAILERYRNKIPFLPRGYEISNRAEIPRQQAKKESVFELPKSNKAYQEYERVCDYILNEVMSND